MPARAMLLSILALPFSLLAADKPALRFTEHLIADKYGYTFGSAAADLDGDGDLDLTNVDIVGKRPSAASMLWFENDGQGNLQRHVIHDQEDGWLERHCVGDINGDQRPDIAVVSNRDGLLLWFAHPGKKVAEKWQRFVISTKCPHAYESFLLISTATATSMRRRLVTSATRWPGMRIPARPEGSRNGRSASSPTTSARTARSVSGISIVMARSTC